jgi:hypothetical protein
MKRHLAITAVMLLCSFMFFVVVCAAADMTVIADPAASPARPSMGTWSGTTYILGQGACPPEYLQFISVGKGVSSLTGASDYFAVYCVKLATGEGLEGDAVITAANGDALFLKIAIVFDFVNGTWLQDEIICDGTGRFAGASGQTASSGTLTPTGDAKGVWEATSAGEISF